MSEQKIKLRPVTETPDGPYIAFWHCADGTLACSRHAQNTPFSLDRDRPDLGWLPLSAFELPAEPNPVYAGDEVRTRGGNKAVVIGPCAGIDSQVWIEDGFDAVAFYLFELTYNNRPVTHFEYGRRPEVKA